MVSEHRILRQAHRDDVTLTILREAVERYKHELMDDDKRMMLEQRIKALPRQLRLS
jgi:hypothetical protein